MHGSLISRRLSQLLIWSSILAALLTVVTG
jgi:hypothetical protein